LSDTGTINLTEVQIACLALWENEKEEKAFLKETDRREAVRRLFGNYLDLALTRLEPRFQKPAITALTFLVTSSGTRNVVSEEDLLGNLIRDDHLVEPDVREVLKALSRTTRLVLRQARGDSAFYEITSEFLIPWIREKRQAKETEAKLAEARAEAEKQRKEREREAELARARQRVLCLVLALLGLSGLVGIHLLHIQSKLQERNSELEAKNVELAKAKEKAVQLASNANVLLARNSNATGNSAHALAYLAQALRLNPKNRECRQRQAHRRADEA
jgi:hypothetical protein